MNQTHRVAVNFELYTEDGVEKAMTSFSRPQDFRVKEAHWQYYQAFISAPTASHMPAPEPPAITQSIPRPRVRRGEIDGSE